MRDALMPLGFTEQWIDTGEVRLHVVCGPRNGKMPLVLIPGQTLSWRSYAKVLRELSREFEVYATDVRGHGESGWTPGAYDWNRMGRDCAAVLWRVVGRPAIVSGNSSGGIIAGWVAAEAPVLVAGWLPEYDPGFSRAFFDGSASLSCNDHAALISRIKCPTVLLSANSFMHEEFGLVGAMAQDDVRRFEECVPHATVRRVDTQHIVHIGKPREFVRAARELAERIGA